MTSSDDLTAIALLDEPVRRALYDWVVAQGRPVGREEAAAGTGCTRALATFHLDKLAAAGLLATGYQRLNDRRGPGAGRPARIYWRGEHEFAVSLPERRYRMAAEIMATALEGDDPDLGAVSARDAGREQGRRLARAVRGGGGRRVERTRLQRALAEGGYEPIEQSSTIRLRNCPFDALVDAHRPLVCGMNLAIAEGLIEGRGVTALRPVLDPQPGYCCVAFTRSTTAR
jgi:predicted ArsR family transcriptional regulator